MGMGNSINKSELTDIMNELSMINRYQILNEETKYSKMSFFDTFRTTLLTKYYLRDTTSKAELRRVIQFIFDLMVEAISIENSKLKKYMEFNGIHKTIIFCLRSYDTYGGIRTFIEKK
jgi:hypothetical protein